MDIVNTLTASVNTAVQFLRSNGIVPLTHQNWSLILRYWGYFTLVAPIQLLSDFYPVGKTSISSIFNIHGKTAWILQELVSPATLLFTIYSNPTRAGNALPKSHIWLTTLYCTHYFHRSVLSPLWNPSMSPSHAIVFVLAIAFNLVNGSAIGGWLGGYGSAEEVPLWQVAVGSAMFLLGLWGNAYHEEILRDIRRDGNKVKDGETAVMSEDGKRVYKIPQGGLFAYCWFPHYFSEWVEWTGFMIAGGGPVNFLPAAMFVVNEIATMGPRALQGKRWYEKKFGDKAPRDRKAVVPGVF
ncbi:3-oxo-5-alpha-steroid 4-dehydrogenase-domain-containing protein [Trichophaea hybrida]|nr:3-oxo-5-alpha-steroid 4-dehydrogenase-domain-containing protein [Trichophaea hybrida]